MVNEDLMFNFASPADKARWQAAGSPKLSNPSGSGYTGPVTGNYHFQSTPAATAASENGQLAADTRLCWPFSRADGDEDGE